MSGNRDKSHLLHARVVKAMIACKCLTVQQATFKSDVSYRTAKRVLEALKEEELVSTKPNPKIKGSTLYIWNH